MTLTRDFVRDGVSLVQMSLTGHVREDQQGLLIQVQISTIPVLQVGKMPFFIFAC